MKTLKADGGGVSPADVSATVNNARSLFQESSSLERVSVTEIAGHVCPSCSKEFETKQLLTRHLLIHSQSGPFPCDYCSEELEDKSSLRAHWRFSHGSDGSHMCNTCGQSFLLKESLVQHQDVHDRAKRHRCVDCGKAFSFKSDLRKHIIIHTGIRPYICSICCKTFTRSTNLNKHQRLHSGYRPYSCNQCPKTFSCKGDLGRHQIIHSGIKPFSCSICTLSFTRKDKLTKHEKMHNGGALLAFTCPACPATFTRKEELTKHSQFTHFSAPGMDGLLMYVSELVKETECAKGCTSLSEESTDKSCKDVAEEHAPTTHLPHTHSRRDQSAATNCQSINYIQSAESSHLVSLKPGNISNKILNHLVPNSDDIKVETHFVDCGNLRVS